MSKVGPELMDGIGRAHNYLRVSLTDRCNLRCTYCMPADGIELKPKEQMLSTEELLDIVGMFVKMGVNKVRLTGGEPLVRKDADAIIRALGKLPIQLAITTNALLVHKFIDTFKEVGLKHINVSLDTLRPDRFERIARRDSFDATWKNIELLISEGFLVKLNTVVMKNINDDELLDFVELTKDRNIHTRFIEFMPFDGNKWNWDKVVSKQEILDKIELRHTFTKQDTGPHSTVQEFKVPGYQGSFGVIASMTDQFCSGCNRLRLTADGHFRNCLFAQNEVDLLTPYREERDLKPIIASYMKKKNPKHGGLDFNSVEGIDQLATNRSMIQIGG